jgi:hypothetical protein
MQLWERPLRYGSTNCALSWALFIAQHKPVFDINVVLFTLWLPSHETLNCKWLNEKSAMYLDLKIIILHWILKLSIKSIAIVFVLFSPKHQVFKNLKISDVTTGLEYHPSSPKGN